MLYILLTIMSISKLTISYFQIKYIILHPKNKTFHTLQEQSKTKTISNIVLNTRRRPFVMATMGEVSAQSELVQEFFNFLNTDEGKAVIQKVGLILPN